MIILNRIKVYFLLIGMILNDINTIYNKKYIDICEFYTG